PGRPDFGKLKRISFSAWTRPTRWDGYNEIFRKEDGNRRVLFSFQENGRILSLGLNIGGYIECDAPIDLATLMDGRWHHCAATFIIATSRAVVAAIMIFFGDMIWLKSLNPHQGGFVFQTIHQCSLK
ncbi:MAG: hypothetical protein QF536_10445, partial [Arenicellales bacterium]|nr:hypothetical protein [Arenicellales bacterium]